MNNLSKKERKRQRRLTHKLRDTLKNKRKKFDCYTDYMNSEEWRIVKKVYLSDKDSPKSCQSCGSKKHLNVHHASYRKIYTMHEIKSLSLVCRECHQKIHDIQSKHKNIPLDTVTKIVINNKHIDYAINVENEASNL